MKKYKVIITTIFIAGILMLSSCTGKKDSESDLTKYQIDYSDQESDAPNTEDSYSTEQESEPNIPESTEGQTETISVSEILEFEAGTVLSEEELENVDTDELFTSEMIPDRVFERMEGVSFGEDCTTGRDELRYLRILHTGFDGKTHIGEIVCNKDIAEDLIDIFQELYQQEYPIEKIFLVDEYGGDDELSMEDNNTSCFNFRPVAGTGHLSQHAYGRAIDINPLYNPYITSDGYTPVNAGDYIDRSSEYPHKITETDLCYRLFTEKGFTWGGNWNSVKDYQHFQKSE